MGRRDKVLWFEYKKETNIFCVATFSVVLVLFIASKLSVKAVVGMCIADYVLFVGKELFYANHGGLCFFEVYGVVEINLLRIALCVMFSLIVMTYRILLQQLTNSIGITKITAGTAINNTPSVSLLKSVGFELIGTEKVSFYKDAQGNDIVFEGGIFELNRVQ